MSPGGPIVVTTRSEAETLALGAVLARALRPGDLVALSGELGAGKTRLVRGIAAGLGLDARRVSSPTFVLMHEYEEGPSPRCPLVHVDAYRLSPDDDLALAGWDRATAGDAVVVVEWPERIEEHLPAERFRVTMEHAGAEERVVTIEAPPGRDLEELLADRQDA